MAIKIIAALSANRVIGNKGKIPWFIKGELKRFKEITMGHNVVMGRKTYDSIGRILDGRKNIIITNNKNYSVDGAVIDFLSRCFKKCDISKDILLLEAPSIRKSSRLLRLSSVDPVHKNFMEILIFQNLKRVK